jgi:hypothetical protein
MWVLIPLSQAALDMVADATGPQICSEEPEATA